MEFMVIGVIAGIGLGIYSSMIRDPAVLAANGGDPYVSAAVIAILVEAVIIVALIVALIWFDYPSPPAIEASGGIHPIQTSSVQRALNIPWSRLVAFGIGLFYFLVMLAGMCGEYMFRLKKWSDFRLIALARPFWVSFIVFGVPWSTIDQSTISLGSVILCYQNGFFWKVVLGEDGKR